MRYFLPVAALFLLVASCERGHADWQSFALNHRERVFVSPFGGYALEPRGSAQIITVPYADEQEAIAKALRDQKTCGEIVMYMDAGIVRSRPDGCRK